MTEPARVDPPVPFERRDMAQAITTRFEEVVRALPDHVALTGNGERWTYEALNRRANQLAHGILARTTDGPGCVALFVDQAPLMAVLSLAVLKAGKALVAVHPGAPQRSRNEIVADAAPDLIVAGPGFEESARMAAGGACVVMPTADVPETGYSANPELRTRPDAPAMLSYTSGSTGTPKGVVWSHRRMMHRVWLSTTCQAITPRDRQSLLRHCAFAAAQTDVIVTLLHGATLCVFDVTAHGLAALSSWINREAITVMRFPTLLFRRFLATLDDQQAFPSVRMVNVGGDILLSEDLEKWKRHFPRPGVLQVRFSATEAAEITAAYFDHDSELGPEGATTGQPVPDKQLTVVDDRGAPVLDGQEGDLVVTSAFLADGYWKDPAATARAFMPDPDDPGRRSYRTGDRGRLLPDGRFVFMGRLDHLVKIRGYRVDLREVEAALRTLDDVKEAAVVAVKDDDRERLLALITPVPGARPTPTALRARLLAQLPDWKVPSRLFVVSSLPMTLNGKVDAQRVRELAIQEEGTQTASEIGAPPVDTLERRIAALWQPLLRCHPIGRFDDFFLLGGDSIQAAALHVEVERLAGRLIPIERLFAKPTLEGMAAVVRAGSERTAPGSTALPAVLVPFRTTGTLCPLFLVHGRVAWTFARPKFLDILGPDQPLYGFQASGLDRTQMRRNTIEEMAQQYVAAMKQVQPSGPYLVGAACAGGLLAIEMANQLRRAGDAVGPLILFDPPNLARAQPWWRRYRRIARVWLRRRTGRSAWHDRNRKRLEARQERLSMPGERADEQTLNARMNAALDFEIARVRYTRWRYDGPALILGSTHHLRRDHSSTGGIFNGRLTGEVQWFDAGSGHHEVVRGDSELAATQIRRCLDAAQAAIAQLSHRRSST